MAGKSRWARMRIREVGEALPGIQEMLTKLRAVDELVEETAAKMDNQYESDRVRSLKIEISGLIESIEMIERDMNSDLEFLKETYPEGGTEK